MARPWKEHAPEDDVGLLGLRGSDAEAHLGIEHADKLVELRDRERVELLEVGLVKRSRRRPISAKIQSRRWAAKPDGRQRR